MKQCHFSDPNLFELFRIDSRADIIDTDQVAWNSCNIIQRAMGSFQPDLFQPEVLIKLSNESPLIRTGIEEMEIEERSESAALYAELWNLGEQIKELLSKPETIRRYIAIERRSGTLQAAMITTDMIPQEVSVRLLNKVCDDKKLKKRSLFAQMPANTAEAPGSLNTSDDGIHHLLSSVKNYLEKQIGSDVRAAISKQNQKKRFSQTDPGTRVISTKSKEINPSIALKQAVPVSIENSARDHTGENGLHTVVHSRFKNKSEGLKNKKSQLLKTASIDPDTGEVNWLDVGQQVNWKQRKTLDRTIVDLAEQISKLPKNHNAITREMTFSFLASLTELQLEFMEELVGGLTPNSEPQSRQNQINGQYATTGELKRSDAVQSELSKTADSVASKPENSKANIDSKRNITGSQSEQDEFKGISEEEMELHQKILATQKEFNVSYDHAAGMVLK